MSNLHNAAKRGDVEMVLECIAAGMDVNAVGFHGFTPLQNAAQNGFPKVVRELLKAGADPNLAAKGSPPLTKAASGGHLAVVKILVEAGATIDSNQGGYTAVNLATMFGRSEIIAYLEGQDASFDMPDDQGKTANDWVAIGGVQGKFERSFGHIDHSVAKPKDAEIVRKMMTECVAPEDYAAKYGRSICVFGYGTMTFEDKAVEQWAHRLLEILRDTSLLTECEERYLTGEELEEARKIRTRKEKAYARWEKQQAIKASRMRDDEN